MRRRGRPEPDFETNEVPLPGLDGKTTLIQKTASRGIVKLSSYYTPWIPKPEELAGPEEGDRVGLDWQSFSELQADHGLGATFQVLFDAGFKSKGKRTAKSLSEDIKAKISPEGWGRIERHLEYLSGAEDEHGHRSIFLTAAWADLFMEKFSDVWLAAMAQHAYFVLQDDFAFGYLTALLDQQRENEEHVLRGRQTAASAKRGGQVRAMTLATTTEKTLTEMQRLITSGLSIVRAAQIAHRNGFGSSGAANRRLWSRHSRK